MQRVGIGMAKIGTSRDLSKGDIIRTEIKAVEGSDGHFAMNGNISVLGGESHTGKIAYVRITGQEEDNLEGKVTTLCSENSDGGDNSSSDSSNAREQKSRTNTEGEPFFGTMKSNKNRLLQKDL